MCIYIYIYIYIFFFFFFFFGCIGSLLLNVGFLQLQRAGASLHCGARASHCSGFSCCGAWALGAQASVVVARGLSSCGSWALERRLSSCGTRACSTTCGVFLDQGLNLCPCIGILNHCATREVPESIFNKDAFFFFFCKTPEILLMVQKYLISATLVQKNTQPTASSSSKTRTAK